MEIINLKKELQYLYHASAKEAIELDVPAMNFLMVDGEGDPNTSSASRWRDERCSAHQFPAAHTSSITTSLALLLFCCKT